MQQIIDSLEQIISRYAPLLSQLSEDELIVKPAPDKWSRKEIIGHLIDSATNNHHRFVRGQFEEVPTIVYDQNQWNACNYYQQMEGPRVIDFWTAYNRQLLELIKRMPENALRRQVNTGGARPYTIEYLIHDYVVHLEHHLRQVVNY